MFGFTRKAKPKPMAAAPVPSIPALSALLTNPAVLAFYYNRADYAASQDLEAFAIQSILNEQNLLANQQALLANQQKIYSVCQAILKAVGPQPVAGFSISLNQKAASMNINVSTNPGPTYQFTATPEDVLNKPTVDPNALTWASDTPTVATVDNTGLVTFVGLGTTNLTVSDGTVTSAPFPVTFTDPTTQLIVNPPAGLNP